MEAWGSARSVTFGLRLPNSGPLATAEAVIEAAQAAEELGYDAVWVHDHISWTPDKLTHFAAGSIEACQGQDPNFYESLCTLAVLAGRTKRVKLGVAGLVLPFRDPRVLARQALTIDALSEGRLIMAMGIGAIQNDFDVMQVPRKLRGRLVDEHLAALHAALRDGPLAEFHGERINFSGAGFFPKPKGLQLWIVGRSETPFRRVARWGQGWLVGSGAPPEVFASFRQAIQKFLEEMERPRDSIVFAKEIFVAVEASSEEALRCAALSLEHIFGNLERGLTQSIVGDSRQAVQQLRRYVDAGAQHIELKIIAHSMKHYLTTVHRIAEEVIPEVAARQPA